MVLTQATPAATARAAAGLRRVAGRDLAPALLWHRPGTLICTHLAGASGPVAGRPPSELRRLGAVLRAAHLSAPTPDAATYDGWSAPAAERDLGRYRRRRVADIWASGAWAALGGAGAGPLEALGTAPPPPGPPFAHLHGDPWGGNIIWHRGGPRLVDWEFQRPGEPAEELAYLAAMEGLAPGEVAALLAGYGRPELAFSVALWAAPVAAECAHWLEGDGRPDHARRLRAVALRPPGGGGAAT